MQATISQLVENIHIGGCDQFKCVPGMRTSAVSTLVSTVFLLPGLLTSACSHMEGAGRQALTSHKLLTAKTFKSQVVWCSAKESNCHCTALFSGFWATIWPKCSDRVTSSVSDWNHLREVRLFSYPQLQPAVFRAAIVREVAVFFILFFFLQDCCSWSLCRSTLRGWWASVSGPPLCVFYAPARACLQIYTQKLSQRSLIVAELATGLEGSLCFIFH